MNPILLSVVFALLVIPYQGETRPYRRAKHSVNSDEDLTADRGTQFYCHSLKTCTPGGPKVCGFDEDIPWLVMFDDMCTLYSTNCKHDGRFYPVEKIVCDTRIKYDQEHANETFVVIHVQPTSRQTSRPDFRHSNNTRKPAKVKLVMMNK